MFENGVVHVEYTRLLPCTSTTNYRGEDDAVKYDVENWKRHPSSFRITKERKIKKNKRHVYEVQDELYYDLLIANLTFETEKKEMEKLSREFDHLLVLRHKRILRLLGFSDRTMFLEWFVCDLQELVYSRQTCLTLGNIKFISKQILEGLQYMHGNGFTHRNLSLKSIVFKPNGDVKISDLGFSVHSKSVHPLPPVNKLNYQPPEVLLQMMQCHSACDMWALGAVMVEMLQREKFAHGDAPQDILKYLGEKYFGYFDKETISAYLRTENTLGVYLNSFCQNESAVELLQSLLKLNYKERINCCEALKLSFFTLDDVIGSPVSLGVHGHCRSIDSFDKWQKLVQPADVVTGINKTSKQQEKSSSDAFKMLSQAPECFNNDHLTSLRTESASDIDRTNLQVEDESQLRRRNLHESKVFDIWRMMLREAQYYDIWQASLRATNERKLSLWKLIHINAWRTFLWEMSVCDVRKPSEREIRALRLWGKTLRDIVPRNVKETPSNTASANDASQASRPEITSSETRPVSVVETRANEAMRASVRDNRTNTAVQAFVRDYRANTSAENISNAVEQVKESRANESVQTSGRDNRTNTSEQASASESRVHQTEQAPSQATNVSRRSSSFNAGSAMVNNADVRVSANHQIQILRRPPQVGQHPNSFGRHAGNIHQPEQRGAKGNINR